MISIRTVSIFFLSIEIELRILWSKTFTHPAHQPLALVTMSSSNKWSNIFVSPFFILMWNLYVCVYAGISSIPSSIIGCHSLAEFYLGSNSNLFWCKSYIVISILFISLPKKKSILFIWFSFIGDFYTVLIDIAFFKLNSGIIIFLQYQWR